MIAALTPALKVVQITESFRHKSGHDLTGYEDGTENPKGDDALTAALSADGSSLVAMQQWRHNFTAIEQLSRSEMDDVIGRRRDDNEELDEAPESSHVKRTEQEERLLVDTTYRLGEAAKAGKSGADKMAGSLQSVSTAAKEAAEAIGKLNNSMFDDIATSAVKLEMLKRGYSETDIKKVLGENLLRAMSQMEKAAGNRQISGQGSLKKLAPPKVN